MTSRGPYKRYAVDSSVDLPRRTNCVDMVDLLGILNVVLPNVFPPSKYKFYKCLQVEDCQASNNV